ncbi:hypothetical protein [Jiella sonneratiae]|uniref:Uncharacterized protein n=1 Tax=Jiella sonneratiae TaxID=2816856 RepID=A0ABS3JA02_9HYPH|nr:hypothetical protein [Jiella sonneratiae]MBO0906511.1 hypothetical protein [Jiella sonneratiae]
MRHLPTWPSGVPARSAFAGRSKIADVGGPSRPTGATRVLARQKAHHRDVLDLDLDLDLDLGRDLRAEAEPVHQGVEADLDTAVGHRQK